MRSFKVKAANRKRVGMGIVARLDAIAAAALDSSAKSLLIMLAKHLRTETAGVGGVAWPSLKTLAAQAGMSEDTASRTMGRLEKAGIVITVTKAAQGRSARRAIDWTALAASAPRMRVQDANLRKIQNPEDAGSRPPRMRVLEDRGCGSLTSEDAVSRTPRLGADPFRDPEKESVQGSEKESVQDTREERPTMHPLIKTIADDIRRRLNIPTTDEVSDGQAAPHHAQPAGLHRLPDAAGPVLPDAAPETAVEVGDASTLSPAPATTEPPQPPPSEMSVRVVAPRAETLLSLTAAPASKPKRGKAKQSDEQIAAIAAQVDRMMGRTGCALPGSGRWKQIVSAVNEAGAARVLARVTAMADAAQGLPSPAAAIFAAMAGSEYGTGPILRGHNGWTVKLDDALDAAQIGAKRPPDASGGATHSESRPAPQNAPQPRHSTNGATAWDDMLTTIRATGGLRLSIGLRGSTLSHDPAEHERRCQAVRDIGGWPKLCEMGEGNRGIIRAQWAAAYDRLGVSA